METSSVNQRGFTLASITLPILVEIELELGIVQPIS
jgi:hypothetical protein